jgi:hypothetical protein
VPTIARATTDLYRVLGVDAHAGGDDIARAFRSRAKQLHPDTSTEPDAADKFNELVAAYGVLSNHRTRREYDQTREIRAGRVDDGQRTSTPPAATAPLTTRWTRRRAWTAVIAGALVAVLGVTAALLTWQLHQRDANRHARFDPVTATRVANGDIMFVTTAGQVVRTREPQQHGEGTTLGPTVGVRYDPANPQHVIVDGNTVGRDITLGVVALKLLIGGTVFVVLGARRLRRMGRAPTSVR